MAKRRSSRNSLYKDSILNSVTIFGRGTKSLAAQVKSILAKYKGTLLFPGPSGLQVESFYPGNYAESTGQTFAAADQQVGLAVDAAESLGPELLLNSEFTSGADWTLNGNLVYSNSVGGVSTFTYNVGDSYPTVLQYATTEVNKLYRVQVRARKTGSDIARVLVGAVITNLSTEWQVLSYVYTASGASTLCRLQVSTAAAASAGSIEVDYFSIKEVKGLHAVQATSGYQPYLRRVPKTLGPNLITNGDFESATGWSLGAGWSVSGGKLIANSAVAGTQANQTIPLQGGKYYQFSFTVDSIAGSISTAFAGAPTTGIGAAKSSAGNYNEIAQVATGNNSLRLLANGTLTAQFDNISVREVLEWAYVWQFDSTDDRLQLSAIPFQASDNFWQVAAITVGALGNNRTITDLATSGNTRFANLRIDTTGKLQLVNVNDSGAAQVLTGPTYAQSQQLIASQVCLAGTNKLYADGSLVGQLINSGAYTVTGSYIGGRGGTSELSNNSTQCVMLGKGTIMDSELRILEKFAAKLQGRTL